MKKIVILALCCAVVFSFSGCGGPKKTPAQIAEEKRIEAMNSKAEGDYKKALSLLEGNEFDKARDILKAIPKEAKNSEVANKEILKVDSASLNYYYGEIKREADENEFDAAAIYIEKYEKVIEKNAMYTTWPTYNHFIELKKKVFNMQAEAAKNQLNAVIQEFDTSSNKQDGTKWFTPLGADDKLQNIGLYCYVQENSDKEVLLRLVAGLHQDEWVFFDKIIFDDGSGKTYEFKIKEEDKKTDVGNGVFEWSDSVIDADNAMKLKEFMERDNLRIILAGDEYRIDFTMSQKDKETVKSALNLYDVLVKINRSK